MFADSLSVAYRWFCRLDLSERVPDHSTFSKNGQRHEHRAAAPFTLPHVILHDRVADDDPGEGIQLRPLDPCRPPITGRNRERHHVTDAVAQDVEMPRRLPLTYALSTGQPNLPLQIHRENPPPLPVARKGKDGRLLHRPQQAHPATTVADFHTAVLSPI